MAAEMHQNRYKYLFLILMIIVFTGITGYAQMKKCDFHMDEILTYMLANTQSYTIPQSERLENAEEVFAGFFSVSDEESRFNYKIVWENQRGDTHPPLYYVIIHTVCSFFPNRFSKWMAYSVNLLFGILSILVFYKLCNLIFDTTAESLAAVLLFAVNPAIIEMTTFLRMYVMGMFFCLLLAYRNVRYWGNFDKRFYIGNIVIMTLGTLTHYYFLAYAFFAHGAVAVYFLLKKDLKSIIKLACSAIAGVILAIMIFPGIPYHLLKGGRGTENIENFINLSDYADRLMNFVKIVSKDLTGGLLLLFFAVSVISYFLAGRGQENALLWKKISLGVPAVCYFLTVAKVASYITDRYMTLIYPMILLDLFAGVCIVLKKIFRGGQRENPDHQFCRIVWRCLGVRIQDLYMGLQRQCI